MAAGWLFSLGSPLDAQTVATLEGGASIVEYDGFLVSGAAIASPALRYDTPNLSAGTRGTWVVFESGNQILQWSAAAAWLTPPRSGWRAEFSGSLGASKYADAPGYGHVLGRARVHFHRGRAGAWASGTTGRSFGESPATPFELGLGVWAVRRRLALAGTVTGTWLSGDAYVDVVGAARWSAATVEFDVQAGARPWSERAGRGVYGELSALVSLGERISVVLSGGRYPSDPVRGVVAAKYAMLGIRMNIFGAPAPTLPTIAGATVRAAGRFAESEHGSRARLEIERSGYRGALRVHVGGVQLVELMGDFTDWQSVALTRIGADIWEIRLTVAPGVHRLNVRIDGGPWVVPQGTRLEETEFGGAVGIVVIP